MTLEKILTLKDYVGDLEKQGIQIKKQSGDITLYLKNKTYISIHKKKHGGADGTIYLDTNIFSFGLSDFRREFSENDNIMGYIVHTCIPLLSALGDKGKYSFEELRDELFRVLRENSIEFEYKENDEVKIQGYYFETYEKYIQELVVDSFIFKVNGKKTGIGIQKSRGILLLEFENDSDIVINQYDSYMFTCPTISGEEYIADIVKNFIKFESR